MDSDVFISHSAQDKMVADAVCATLEARGVRCWIAPRDILAGQSWPKAIMSGITGARAMVVIFSAYSNRSEAVLNEIERAYHNNLIIIPFRLDDAPMAPDMEFFLSRRHWLDALSPPMEAHLARLAEQVQQLLPDTRGALPVKEPTGKGDVLAPPKKQPRSRPFPAKIIALIAGFVFLMGILGVIAHDHRPRPSSHSQSAVLPSVQRAAVTANITLAQTLRGHTGVVNSVAFSPDGKMLVSGSEDKTVKLWRTDTGQLVETLPKQTAPVYAVAFSPDDKTIAWGGGDRTVRLWDANAGTGKTLAGRTDAVETVAFSHDGRTLAGGSLLWRVDNGQLLQTLSGHADAVTSVAFSPLGTMLASGSRDNTVKVWNTDTGQLRQTLRKHSDWNSMRSVAFSPDGRMLAGGSDDGIITFWDTTTWQVIRTLPANAVSVFTGTTPLTSLAFSPNGKLLVAASADKTMRLWDTTTGQLLQTLREDAGPENSVAFSPDGKTFATGSSDHTIKVWSVTTRQ